jgi:uroporphyrinogen-III synthase
MPMPAPVRLQRLIVTRPAPEAATWVSALQGAGWPAQALPLIEIGEPRSLSARQALAHWRGQWPTMDALMFVSAAAVRHFFAGVANRPDPAAPTRFWAPGPGTARVLAQALQGLGLGPERIDAPAPDAPQFDSESLWPVVQPRLRPGQQLLIVRGHSAGAAAAASTDPDLPGHGRDWLIEQCQAAGVQVLACVAYERRAPNLDATNRRLLQQGQAPGSVWLFSSSEALEHLQACAPAADWSRASALVTHPRIEQRARDSGFGTVVPTRPALPDVLRALESGWNPP